jgi:hypothetical protein
LHNSLADGKPPQLGIDDVLTPAPPPDADAAADPAPPAAPDPPLDPVPPLDRAPPGDPKPLVFGPLGTLQNVAVISWMHITPVVGFRLLVLVCC